MDVPIGPLVLDGQRTAENGFSQPNRQREKHGRPPHDLLPKK